MMKPMILALMVVLSAYAATAASDLSLAFRMGATNDEFSFDTGVLRGKLRADGKSMGLSSVVHIPSGAVLDRSMGLFSHYRLFTKGRRYGGGVWDLASQASLRADGAVEVTVPSTPDRPFELRMVYWWQDASTLDLETGVKAERDLPGFEVFLASYFAPQFTNSLVFTAVKPEPTFVNAARSAADWQVFARDDSAVGLINDGRWAFPPYPVQWTVCGRLAQPLAIRRAPELNLTALLMAAPRDCFAIATPYETEPHYSTYLSLFGRTMAAGEMAHARTRLVIRSLSNAEAVRLYDRFVKDLPTN
jgi:hypothetical protein